MGPRDLNGTKSLALEVSGAAVYPGVPHMKLSKSDRTAGFASTFISVLSHYDPLWVYAGCVWAGGSRHCAL